MKIKYRRSHFGYTQIDANEDMDIEILNHQTGVKSKFDLKDEIAPIALGTHPNERDEEGDTPLHRAAGHFNL